MGININEGDNVYIINGEQIKKVKVRFVGLFRFWADNVEYFQFDENKIWFRKLKDCKKYIEESRYGMAKPKIRLVEKSLWKICE